MTGGSAEQHPPLRGDGFARAELLDGHEHLITLAHISRAEVMIIAQRLALGLQRPVTITARSHSGAQFSCLVYALPRPYTVIPQPGRIAS